MQLESTRNPSLAATFADAIVQNLAPDGGLFAPVALTPLPDLDRLLALPWLERNCLILQHLLGDEFAAADLMAVAHAAFDFPVPLVAVGPDLYALELWHGPSLAFKDFGARFLARMLALRDRTRNDAAPRTILTATSGDTGAAVARAFWRLPGFRAVVLYPRHGVTDLQERQFACLGDNVQALAVDGTFDDCQALAKACFADPELSARLRLTSANSINIARLLAQVLYYFEAVAQLRAKGDHRPPVIAVPSGNFGNLCAGLYAQRLGCPVTAFVAATNANTTVPDYLDTGDYRPRPSVATIANAMDVGAPSNWERIEHLFRHDLKAMRSSLRWASLSDDGTRAEIRWLFDRGYLADPHGALACAILRERKHSDEVGVFLATAHPAKFASALAPVLGASLESAVPLPPALAEVATLPRQSTAIANDIEVLREFLLDPGATRAPLGV